MKRRTLKKLLLIVTVVLAIITLGIFVTAETPWLAYVTGFAGFTTFCCYMDMKNTKSRRTR